MSKNLILISHGYFCEELKKSVEMIMGTQENIIAVPLLEEEGKEEYRNKLLSVMSRDSESVVFADLKGGSPSNIASELLLEGYTFNLYTGLNMPMVIEFINSDLIGTELDPVHSGKESIVYINDLINIPN